MRRAFSGKGSAIAAANGTGLLSHGTVQRSQDLAGRIYSHDNNGRNRPQQQRPQQVTKPAAQKPCLRRRFAIVTAAVGPEFLIDDKEKSTLT